MADAHRACRGGRRRARVGHLLAEPSEYMVGLRVGLPPLGCVPIPRRWKSHTRAPLGSWKGYHLAAWIGQRPFVWFDDDAEAVARLAGQPSLGRHLVVKVDPVIGFIVSHVEQARAWLSDLHR